MELFKIFEDGVKALSDIRGFFVEFLTQPQSVVAQGRGWHFVALFFFLICGVLLTGMLSESLSS